MIIFYTNIIYLDNFYINVNKKEFIEIDNEFKINLYEKKIVFENITTKIKPIALYHPEFNNISYIKYFNKSKKFIGPNKYEIEALIKTQIHIARKHQIYGFAIYFKISTKEYYSRITLNIILNKTDFPFFLIWKNDEYKIINKYNIDEFITNIKNYIISKNYKKIQNKPVLSIDNPNKMKNRNNVTNLLRKELKYMLNFFYYISI